MRGAVIMRNELREKIIKANRAREEAAKELEKINCHLCGNAIIYGNGPDCRFVGSYGEHYGIFISYPNRMAQ
jgi:hypothetical protein